MNDHETSAKDQQKELSKEEMENVQGGLLIGLILILGRPQGEDPVLSITRVDPA